MMSTKIPTPPSALRKRGRRFWRLIMGAYELTDPETELLVEVCACLDMLDTLAEQVAADGQMVTGSAGQAVLHPAVGEARQQRLALSRMLSQLDLPDDDGKVLATPRQVSARHAAHARWVGVETEAAAARGGA